MTDRQVFYIRNDSISKLWSIKKSIADRKDGPAIECSSGRRDWFRDRKRHREDGPAIIYEDGRHEYFLNGIQYSKEIYCIEIEKMRKRNDFKS